MNSLQLDPKKTALVIIDLQQRIVARTSAPHTSSEVMQHSNRLAKAFRAKGSSVVYVRVDMSDPLRLPVDAPPVMADDIPPSASELAPEAGFQTGDLLITKRHWGAFAGTDLEKQLRQRGVDTSF
jgi:nicotinamidase-related amidase